MKVYVITQGSYSDYHICAVATDPEQAEKLARIYSDRYDTAEVEEYDTEEHQDWLCGRVPYAVTFYRRLSSPYVSLLRYTEKVIAGIDEDPDHPSVEMRVRLYAPDSDTALKIAQDKRAEYLAQKAGI